MRQSLVLISMILHLISSLPTSESIVSSNMNEGMLLEYDYYHSTCPTAEHIIRDNMSQFIKNDTELAAQLLRLLFHDCFIQVRPLIQILDTPDPFETIYAMQGCDASVFLNDRKGNNKYNIEKEAVPNQTLKGFDKIDMIKKALEVVCPGVVSCSDIIAVAVRDGIILSGGPYYPVLTGRKDSLRSYFDEAQREIPGPNTNLTHMLDLFAARGFTTRDVVSLLGAHNIGKINCEFVQGRFHNFHGTGSPDPSIPRDFLEEMRSMCQVGKTSDHPLLPTSLTQVDPSSGWIKLSSKLTPSLQSGNTFDSHYYERLIKGHGFLHSDQQLMAHPRTAQLVRVLASDNGSTFRREFVQAMIKLSNLGALTNSHGEVRRDCSLPN